MSAKDSIASARRVLDIEARAIGHVGRHLNDDFERALELILGCKGKVIVTGMGKSGHIAGKIAATFASTGTPAVYVHPAEGMHGDLGVIAASDVVLAISYSGSSPEVVGIIPGVRRIGAPLIAMTGNDRSPLAEAADVALNVEVEEEACPLGLAPTASTTATLALGDALAVVLLERRGFTSEDFALFHPGGALGRRLLMQVRDLMHRGDAIPRVGPDTRMSSVVMEMSAKRLGITGVFDESGRLLGCVTDGDLRRGMQKFENFFERRAAEVMTPTPKGCRADDPAVEALRFMEQARITVLFVTDADEAIAGVIHMHDLLRAGLG